MSSLWSRYRCIQVLLILSNAMERKAFLTRRGFLHDDAYIVGVDQVGHRPPVQIVFRHALLREAFIFGCLAERLSHHEHLEANALVAAEVIAFVELVASAELGTHGIPHQ